MSFISMMVDGIEIVNTTPHELSFDVQGVKVTVPQSGMIINASAREEVISTADGIEIVKTVFMPTKAGMESIYEIESTPIMDGASRRIIVGSMIAAQAYPMNIACVTPASGYERVAPSEKRMNPKKFTMFTS